MSFYYIYTMSFYDKYLKYKSKYIQLKLHKNYIQYGGDKPFLNVDDKINFFSTEMSLYLNPIHGLILCENGFIKNNFFLLESGFIDTEESKIIKKICKKIPGDIQPTNKIMQLKPIDFGRYIALKYISKDNDKFITISKKGNINISIKKKKN